MDDPREQEQRAIEERNEELAEMYAQADNAQPIKDIKFLDEDDGYHD
jgi:hypothetical protein